MKTILLLLVSTGGLSAQIALTPTFNITKADADVLIWMVNRNFQAEADTNANEVVSPVETREWIYSKLSEVLTRFIERGYKERREFDRAEITPEHKALLDAFEASKTALEAYETRK